ncbi:MAG: ATP-binding cassette domain-containing protein [Alcaligenaceae bacterium]|nr:ATP-binding cassette domain-containing protein [Alcaligenaceae bacterium]
MTNFILETKNLSKHYQEGERQIQILNNVNWGIEPEAFVSIIGASGSGKSTLLHLLGLLDQPSQGDIYIHGESVSHLSDTQKSKVRNDMMGFVYQFHHLLGDFSAMDNVAMPLIIRGLTFKEARERAVDLLEKVGLGQRIEASPAQLSGGERQRVAIARALVGEPKIVFADEPTGNLDYETAQEVLDLILQINQRFHTAFVVVTHDLSLAAKAQHQYCMKHGQLTPYIV